MDTDTMNALHEPADPFPDKTVGTADESAR